jgi:hypothetical protein
VGRKLSILLVARGDPRPRGDIGPVSGLYCLRFVRARTCSIWLRAMSGDGGFDRGEISAGFGFLAPITRLRVMRAAYALRP